MKYTSKALTDADFADRLAEILKEWKLSCEIKATNMSDLRNDRKNKKLKNKKPKGETPYDDDAPDVFPNQDTRQKRYDAATNQPQEPAEAETQ